MTPAPAHHRDHGGGASAAGASTPDKDELKRAIADFTPTLLSEIAENWAEAVAREGGNTKNKSTQLRRFYNEVCHWHEQAGRAGRSFAEILPFVLMIKAKVAYAQARGHVGDIYYAMICAGLEAIHKGKSEEEQRQRLEGLKLFLEAFTGFHAAEEKSKGQK